MKKKFLLLLLCIVGICFYAYNQRYFLFQYLPNTEDTGQFQNIDGLLCDESSKPFSGRILKKRDTHTSIYSYQNGKLHGLSVLYGRNKSKTVIKEIGCWENNKQNGLFQLYTDDGILLDSGYFKDGERHGLTEQYYLNGSLKIKANYNQGKKNGICENYYDNGIPYQIGEYQNGKRTGTIKQFYPDGSLQIEQEYQYGLLHGKTTSYFPDQTISAQGEYCRGSKCGAWKYFYNNGKIRAKIIYPRNETDPLTVTTYREDGSISMREQRIGNIAQFYETYDKDQKLTSPIDLAFPETVNNLLKKFPHGRSVPQTDPTQTEPDFTVTEME